MWQINAKLRGLAPGPHDIQMRTSGSEPGLPARIEVL